MKKLLEKLRNTVFWTLDSIQGGKLKAHYRDIALILEHFESDQSKSRRNELLQQLLKHATDTTKFYEKFRGRKSLKDFPVVDKEFIRDNYDAFQSEVFKVAKKYRTSTSGSSGTPFHVCHNAEKVIRNRADTLYFQNKAGYTIGKRLYYIRKWLPKYRKSGLTMAMRNIEMVDVSNFNDAFLGRLIDRLRKDTSTKVLLGYSSALRDICRFLKITGAQPIESPVSSIIAMAEGLGEETREQLNHYFNAPVYLRYSNQENGIISLQLSQENNHLQINWASYVVEILHPEKDIEVEKGALGRIVITDLFNYAMPFIRYDTGDLGIMGKDGAYFKGTSVFTNIEGRKMDVLWDTQGRVVSGFNIHHLESYPEVKQFQVVQESKTRYRIHLKVSEPLRHEAKVKAYFKKFLGADAEVEIGYHDEILKLPSGKRRLVINEYQKAKD